MTPEMSYAPQPTAVSPAMFEEDEVSTAMYPGLSPVSAPAPISTPLAPMSVAGGDCGCGGPKFATPAAYAGVPTGYGAGPVGYGGLPTGYDVTPAGYGGMPAGYTPGAPVGFDGIPSGYTGAPVGYGGMPAGYTPGAPVGFDGIPSGYTGAPVGYGGIPAGYAPGAPVGYGSIPTGYGGAPIGYGVPAGFRTASTGLPGVSTSFGAAPMPQGAFTQPGFPYGTPMTPPAFGEQPYHDSGLDGEDDDTDW